jgi:hypothetical protein
MAKAIHSSQLHVTDQIIITGDERTYTPARVKSITSNEITIQFLAGPKSGQERTFRERQLRSRNSVLFDHPVFYYN